MVYKEHIEFSYRRLGATRTSTINLGIEKGDIATPDGTAVLTNWLNQVDIYLKAAFAKSLKAQLRGIRKEWKIHVNTRKSICNGSSYRNSNSY